MVFVRSCLGFVLVLACGLAGCAAVQDASPLRCPAGQEPSGNVCVCIDTQAPPVEGSCETPMECSVDDCVDDGNPCTEPTCASSADACRNEPVPNSTPCELDEATGACISGECISEPPVWELGVPFRIHRGSGEELSIPQIAVAADGAAMALWSEGESLMACSFDPDEGWDAAVVVEPRHMAERGIALGIDALGHAVALYARLERASVDVVAERYDPSTELWNDFQVISEPGAITDDPRLAVTPDGDIAAVWWQGPGDVVLARGSTDPMTWQDPSAVSPDDALDKYQASVSLSSDGSGAIIYRAKSGDGGGAPESVWVVPVESESVGAAAQVSDALGWVVDPRIAVATDGDKMAVWREGNDLAYAGFREGAWGAAALIEEGAGVVEYPGITVDEKGDFTTAWVRGTNVRTKRFVSADAAWDATQILLVSSTAGAREPTLAAPSSGHPRIAWFQDRYVRMSRFTLDSAWAPFQKLSDELDRDAPELLGPRLAVGTDGTEVVVWAEGEDVWAWAEQP